MGEQRTWTSGGRRASDGPKTVWRYGAQALIFALALGLSASAQVPSADTRAQVMAAERAFAKTMADRNLEAFAGFVADDAIFFSGPEPRRGKSQVVEWWSRFFAAGTAAPFSWEPDQVEVLPSGGLAWSTGPVRDPQGKIVSRFNSIWRRGADGNWRIIFDKGDSGPPP